MVSNEMRRLTVKWDSGSGWPLLLNWIEIRGLRGWTGQRFEMKYPIMAVVGENGVGKSSVLQAAAAIHRSDKGRFASDFFPETYWEKIADAEIRFSVRQGPVTIEASVRKPGQRWRGNPKRPERNVAYIDLSRIQPVPARTGYTRLVKSHHEEVAADHFDGPRLGRYSAIMGRRYDFAKMALTSADTNRYVPVLQQDGVVYSGFHQGAGETTVAELLEADAPPNSIVLIDEIESSLHPRAQRRLVRDLAERCREHNWQVILTTHSPAVLEELPPQARACILQVGGQRDLVYGVSPEFAMTKMDEVAQPECDLYVEDLEAQTLLSELLVRFRPEIRVRCQIIPFGAAGVGKALGQMVSQGRFPRPSRVFLDGDQPETVGCILLPGDDAPERVVFAALRRISWQNLHNRLGRSYADVADACTRATLRADHHHWLRDAASALIVGGDQLWQAMCAEWVSAIPEDQGRNIAQAVEDALEGLESPVVTLPPPLRTQRAPSTSPKPQQAPKPQVASAERGLFDDDDPTSTGSG